MDKWKFSLCLIIQVLIHSSFSLPTSTTSKLETPSPTAVSVQTTVSVKRSKAISQEPILMELLDKNSYFPKDNGKETGSNGQESKISEISLEPITDSPSTLNTESVELTSPAVSYGSSAWTPLTPNALQVATYGQPVYFPAPAVYGYPVNNYGPPVIALGGEQPTSGPSYEAKDELNDTPAAPLTQLKKNNEAQIYNVPVKSVEYVAPVKTEYANPEYNSIRKPYDTAYVGPSSSYPTPASPYEVIEPVSKEISDQPSPYGRHIQSEPLQSTTHLEGSYPVSSYGAPSGPAPVYQSSHSKYGPPSTPLAAYGPAPTAIKKNVHNLHQKVLHRYNHHQKVLHEHNLHRYIVHNYHLHRYHVHNYHLKKDHIHQHKTHVHNQYAQKETEEHQTRETGGETHKHVSEHKESHRQAPPIHAPMHVVKPHWSIWG